MTPFQRARCVGARARLALLSVATIGLVSCAESPAGLDAPFEPFYYWQEGRVLLDVDVGRIVVRPPVDADWEAIERELAAEGLTAGARREIYPGTGDRAGVTEVTVDGSPTPTRLRTAMRRLRQSGYAEFASLVYRTREGGGQLLPIDRFLVEFVPEASAAQIAAFLREFGTAALPSPSPFFRVLDVPLGLEQEPLELANTMFEHPLTVWAELDGLTDVSPSRSAALSRSPGSGR